MRASLQQIHNKPLMEGLNIVSRGCGRRLCGAGLPQTKHNARTAPSQRSKSVSRGMIDKLCVCDVKMHRSWNQYDAVIHAATHQPSSRWPELSLLHDNFVCGVSLASACLRLALMCLARHACHSMLHASSMRTPSRCLRARRIPMRVSCLYTVAHIIAKTRAPFRGQAHHGAEASSCRLSRVSGSLEMTRKQQCRARGVQQTASASCPSRRNV